MSELTDVETVIKKAQPGLMLYVRVKTSVSTDWQTVLYIREDAKHIYWLPENPIVEMRSGVLEMDNVYLVPIMIKAGGETYESWLNYCSPDGHGACALQALASQEQNVILYFGDSGKQERSLIFKNSCKKSFGLILDGIKNKSVWTMAEFDQAREKVYRKYPDLSDLWRELR